MWQNTDSTLLSIMKEGLKMTELELRDMYDMCAHRTKVAVELLLELQNRLVIPSESEEKRKAALVAHLYLDAAMDVLETALREYSRAA